MFKFAGMKLEYLRHPYNRASENMRTVEVPIINEILRRTEAPEVKILEIGNVLSHYREIHWPVLDLLEKGPTVINESLMTFKPESNFDLIVSISTIEHIGFGKYAKYTEPAPTPEEILYKVKSLLNVGGEAYITVPIGYNPSLDKYLKILDSAATVERDVGIIGCMARWTESNDWAGCTLEQAYELDKRRGNYSWSKGMVLLGVVR